MKYRLKFMPATIRDRNTIKAYLSQFYPGTSKRFFAHFKKKTAQIQEHPLSCPIYENNPIYRKMVVDDYLVFYVVNDAKRVVEIRRILHGAVEIPVEIETTK